MKVIESLQYILSTIIKYFRVSYQLIVELYNYITEIVSAFSRGLVTYSNEIIISMYIALSLLFLLYNVYFAVFTGLLYLVYSVNKALSEVRASLHDNAGNKDLLNEIQSSLNIIVLESYARLIYYLSLEKASLVYKGAWAQASEKLENMKFIDGTSNKGLYILLANDKEDKSNLVVITRGTDLENLDGMFENDFDDKGPAYSLYMGQKSKIDSGILDKLKAGEVKTISLTGHSAGGAVSMLMLNSILEKMCAEEASLYDSINTINVSIFQSAGTNDDVCHSIEESMRILKEKRPNFRLNFVSCVHDYDPVHSSGRQVLGDYHESNAKVYLIRKHINIWTFLLQVFRLKLFFSHSLSFFCADPDPMKTTFEHYVSEDSVLEAFSSEVPEHRPNISSVYNSVYTKLFCNGAFHSIAQGLGSSGIGFLLGLFSISMILYAFASNLLVFYMIPSFMSLATIYYFIPQLMESLIEFYVLHSPFITTKLDNLSLAYTSVSRDFSSMVFGAPPMKIDESEPASQDTQSRYMLLSSSY